MAKVMMDSEIVEALATLAAHGIEAMKVKPKMLAEDAQWDPSILEAAGPGRPFEFNKIKFPLGGVSNDDLRAELMRRGHQVPEIGKGVIYGPVRDDEAIAAATDWNDAPMNTHESWIDCLTRFAKSRGLL